MTQITDNQKHASSSALLPWYRHRWPWILISVPAASVVLGIILITTAIKNPAILVVDNYYAEGRAINRSLEQDQRARDMGVTAQLSVSADNVIAMVANSPDAALRLSVYHATDERRDRHFVLLPDVADNAFSPVSADQSRLLTEIMSSQGSWYFELKGETEQWRLRHRFTTPASEVSF
jgi:uncharacterized protein